MKRNRRHNYHRIKANDSYTLKEIAEKLKVHVRTVQQWRKCGMKTIDDNSKPYLVLGTELKRFLKEQRQIRKVSLNQNEFYCTKCRCARESIPNQVSILYTNKIVGKNQKLVHILGLCNKCGSKMYRFSTETKMEELNKSMLIPNLCDLILIENDDSSLNTDIGGIENEQHTT